MLFCPPCRGISGDWCCKFAMGGMGARAPLGFVLHHFLLLRFCFALDAFASCAGYAFRGFCVACALCLVCVALRLLRACFVAAPLSPCFSLRFVACQGRGNSLRLRLCEGARTGFDDCDAESKGPSRCPTGFYKNVYNSLCEQVTPPENPPGPWR